MCIIAASALLALRAREMRLLEKELQAYIGGGIGNLSLEKVGLRDKWAILIVSDTLAILILSFFFFFFQICIPHACNY